jgi:hypothetical protein
MSSFVNTGNNNNVPTLCEIVRNLPNFHRTSYKNLYSKFTDVVIDKIVKNNNTIVLVYETSVEDDGWINTYFEPYKWAVLITKKFMELVDNNGGLFNGFDAYNGSVERILTNMDIKVVNTQFPFGYSYPLNFTIGFFPNKVSVARGSLIENEIYYNFNSIFMRLYGSIVGKFSLNEMKINTHFIGNNSSRLNESFEF